MENIKFYSIQEVGEVLHVSRQMVSRIRNCGLLSFSRFGKSWLISEADLIAFVEENKGKDLSKVVREHEMKRVMGNVSK